MAFSRCNNFHEAHNCSSALHLGLLKHVIEGKIKGEMEVARRRGRRRKKLLDGSHHTQKLPSKTRYRRKDKGGDGSGKKTRKKA